MRGDSAASWQPLLLGNKKWESHHVEGAFKTTRERCDKLLSRSTDQVWIEAGHRFDRNGLDLVVDDGSANLAEAIEDTFHDHLIPFMNLKLAKAHDLEGTGLILEEESVGWLSLAIGRQLNIHDLAGDDDVLMIVLLRVRQ